MCAGVKVFTLLFRGVMERPACHTAAETTYTGERFDESTEIL